MLYPHKTPAFFQKIMPSLVWQKKSEERTVFLTFDDGPHPEITPWVLQELKQRNLKATFFCVGANVAKYPDTYQQILDEGHQTGNHTQRHKSGWTTPNEAYFEEVAECSKLVHSKLFRPPYGRITPAQTKVLSKNYHIIMWNVITGDFDKNLNQEKALQKLIQFTETGQIIVFHDSVKAENNLRFLLPRYLDSLCEKGFTSEIIT
jgi:peptidoglycan/xylan/chitin deacetylase (PgdA/CDA1 family)